MVPTVPAQVIPVLDIAHGQVVHGVRGDRATYRPVVSAIVAGSEPTAVAAALLARTATCGPALLYVADLDAIQGGAAQLGVLRALLESRSDLGLWLDAGFAGPARWGSLRRALGAAAARIRPVYGSESLSADPGEAGLDELAADPQAILSLDCRRDRALDPAGAWRTPQRWPRTMVAMTLDRVGAAQGPDLAHFAHLRGQAPDRAWVGAGGIRHAADLQAAAAAGARAWLVASALHDGSLHPG